MASNFGRKYNHELSFGKTMLIGFLLAMVGMSLYFANFLLLRHQGLGAGAATGKADVFFEPNPASLPPDATINLWVTTDKPLGFFATELTFNPALIKLAQDVSLSPPLTRVIRQTTMAEANKTGKITLALGIDPLKLSTAPTGSIKLATLKFTIVTTSANQSASLSITPSLTQIVDTGATTFSITSTPASLTLNPTATPIVTPAASATASPTASPVSTTPVTSNSGPSITINSPKEGSTIPSRGVWIGSTSTDPDGVFQTNFYFDGNLIKTCGVQSVCDYTYRSSVSSGPHTIVIESFDNSSEHIKSIKTVNVVK